MNTETDQLYGELRRIEERIKASEGDSVEARWEFGRALIQRRDGSKQLPRGVVPAIVKEHGISRSEIHRRVQLAEKFTSKEKVSHAWEKYGSWRRLASEALPKREAAPKPAITWEERISNDLDRMIRLVGP